MPRQRQYVFRWPITLESPLEIEGDASETIVLEWSEVNDQQRRTHADLQDATEFGASGLAILLTNHLTGQIVLSRAKKGTGFDYWLGHETESDGLFQHKTRLEVSGILKGDRVTVNQRVRLKLAQTSISDQTGLRAHVAVVEFGLPFAKFVTKQK